MTYLQNTPKKINFKHKVFVSVNSSFRLLKIIKNQYLEYQTLTL